MKTLDSIFPIAFSNTMMSDIWKCELYFFRSHCQKLVSVNKKSSDLLAGGHFAKGCELVRKAYFNENLSIDGSIEKGYNYILDAEDTGDSIKSNERMAVVLEKYFKRFPLDSELTPVKLVNGEHAIEYNFEFDLGIPHPELEGVNLTYKGKLDGLYERRFQGKRTHCYVVDEKTTGQVSRIKGTKLPDLIEEENLYKVDGQFIGYHWAARQLGIQTTGSLIYKVPVLTNHEDAFELNVPITDFMIGHWFTSTVNKIQEITEKYKYFKEKESLIGFSPQYAFYPSYTGNSCLAYRRPCAYTEGCKIPEGEEILMSSMKQVVWDSIERKEVSLSDYKKDRYITHDTGRTKDIS